ncbi:MAG: LysE family translocator, partial [Pseudomonadota bacterium]
MNDYYLFVAIAIVAILSPGPGVLLTLTNALRYKVRGAVSGILGIAFGTFVVAGISATSLGILLMTSATAYTVMRYIGAIYLIYLGLKLWRSAPTGITAQPPSKTNRQRRLQFFEGMMIQITNPKAVFFFISIFPQFIDYSSASIGYFALLVITYSGLIIIIHG